MSQALNKEIHISLKENGKDLAPFSDKVFAIKIMYPSTDNTTKTIQIIDENNAIKQGNYSNIQILFDKDVNYMDIQMGTNSNWTTVYAGKGSRFSIRDSNVTKNIFINKTGGNTTQDWLPLHQGNVEISEILIGDGII